MRYIWILLLANFAHAQEAKTLKGEYFYNIKVPFATEQKNMIAKSGAKTANQFCAEKHYKNAIAFYYELVEGKTYRVSDAFCSNDMKTIKTEALGRLVIARSRQDRETTLATSAAELVKKLDGVQVTGFETTDAVNGD